MASAKSVEDVTAWARVAAPTMAMLELPKDGDTASGVTDQDYPVA